jgi:hypothetical protein
LRRIGWRRIRLVSRCSCLLRLRAALARRRFRRRSGRLRRDWRCSCGRRRHACGFGATPVPHRVAKYKARSTKGEQADAKRSQHGRADRQFPVPGGPQTLFRFLHRLKYRSAKPSLHICLWLTTFYATRRIPNLTGKRPPFSTLPPGLWRNRPRAGELVAICRFRRPGSARRCTQLV